MSRWRSAAARGRRYDGRLEADDTQHGPMTPAEVNPKTDRPARPKRLFARLGLLLVSFAAALFVAELAVRVLGLGVPARGPIATRGFTTKVPADEVPWVQIMLVPNARAEKIYPGLAGEEPRVARYAINEHGFRGRSYSREKPAGTFRIVVLGDSFSYGTGVSLEDTWPDIVERTLTELTPERRIEVLNWAVPAHNTRQQVALLNHWVDDFDPDLVLICAYINDASGENRGNPAAEPNERPWEPRWIRRLGLTSARYGADTPKTPAQARTMALRERSQLVDLVVYKVYGWMLGRVTVRNYREDWSAGSPGLDMVQSALKAATVLSQRHGFVLHATMYPDLNGLAGDYVFRGEHAVFEGLCRELGIVFHDLLPVLEGRDPRLLRAHAHDKHPNGTCNRIVGEHLARVLLPFTTGLARPAGAGGNRSQPARKAPTCHEPRAGHRPHGLTGHVSELRRAGSTDLARTAIVDVPDPSGQTCDSDSSSAPSRRSVSSRAAPAPRPQDRAGLRGAARSAPASPPTRIRRSRGARRRTSAGRCRYPGAARRRRSSPATWSSS